MKKKLLSTVLCLAIILLILPVLPAQTGAETSEDVFYYTMRYDEYGMPEYWVSGIDPSASGEYEIPFMVYDGFVTGIDYGAFEGNTKITRIYIPETVKTINNRAFYGCTNLTYVSLPTEVSFISNDAFAYCSSLESIYIPEGVEKIGSSAFQGCTSLKRISFGGGVTEIWGSAFQGCTSLETVTLPDSVEVIGQSVFAHCDNLKTVDLGNASELGDSAFYYCENLTSVILPRRLKVLEYSTFERCTNLEKITLPSSVTTIENRAFAYCTGMKSFDASNSSLESIGQEAFRTCSSLTELSLPKSTNSIGPGAFFKCTSLPRIDVDPQNQYFASDDSGVLYSKDYTTLIFVPTDLSGVYTVPNTVTAIRTGAFYGCEKLTGLNLSENLTDLGEYAFIYCNGLTEITIPGKLTIISDGSLQSCAGLTKVTIPESVTLVDSWAFYNSTNLQEVYYEGTQAQWDAITIKSANDPLLHAKIILKGEHICTENGEWIVSAEPTFTSAGERSLICSVCGETVTQTLPMLIGEVAQWNIALQDDFEVKLYLQVSESIQSTAQVKLSVGKQTTTRNIAELEKTEDGYFLLRVALTATQMNETITVQVISGDTLGEESSYTVRQYCDTVLADESKSQYHALIKEMLNYGAMAQLYFGYDTENLVNEGITGVATEEIPEETEEMAISGNLSNLEYYGASLVYRNRIAVRFYFTGDVRGCTFTVAGNSYVPVAKNEMYYIEITDILPQNLDQQITLTVTDADGNTLTVIYGPMNYIVRMNQKGDEKTKNLLKALYNYHLAAKAFHG